MNFLLDTNVVSEPKRARPNPGGAEVGLIAATAEVFGLTLVRQSVSDFEPSPEMTLSPWS
jgi:predicted nucleic acid-binding protein